MRSLLILLKKELKQYFLNPFGWIVLTIIVLLQGYSLTSTLEVYEKQPISTNMLLDSISTIIFGIYFLFLFPLITMKLFSEEERSGTMETLMTAPIRTWQVVISKYLAALTFYCCLWLPLILHIKIFTWVTSTPAPATQEHFLGVFTILFLIGTFFIAIGCLASAITSSQIIAAILSFGFILSHIVIGLIPSLMSSSFDGIDGAKGADFFHYIAVQEHIASFGIGLIDSRAFVYYLSMAALTLLVTHHVVDFRRWKN